MRFRDWILTLVVAAFFVLVGMASYNVFQSARRITVEGGEVVQPTALPPAPTLAQQMSTTAPAEVPTIGAAPTPTLLVPTPDPARTTILLLGVDERDIEEGPWRTDTMILFSIDPVRGTISMLSIPRDLWVSIPGYEPSRINQANFFGDASNYPGGGPVLAMRTVEQTLGVPVDHYALVNFEVFLTLMDALIDELDAGGVEICVEEEIHDENYPVPGSYDVMTVHFDAGCQLMSSEQLLQYARTRHGNSDFDRSVRQQQVIRALRDEIVSFGGIQTMLGQAQALWEAVRDGLRTDMTLDQFIALGFAAQTVPAENIRSAVLDSSYVSFGKTPQGQDVLIPDRNSVRALAQMLFSPPLDTEELARLARAREAGASVYVLNGTTVQGLAASAADILREGGLQVDAVQSAASSDFAESIVFVRTGQWYTTWYLIDLLGLPLEVVQPGWGGIPGDWDVLVILGTNYAESLE